VPLFCKHGSETLGFIKCGEILGLLCGVSNMRFGLVDMAQK
jgi:hypothetical protein